jgi:hypothetical protein
VNGNDEDRIARIRRCKVPRADLRQCTAGMELNLPRTDFLPE